MLKNSQTTYGSVAKFFHWLIFLLVLVMIFVGYFMDDVANEATREDVVNIHKVTGITILCLMALRLLWMLINPKPSLPGTAVWERIAERTVHWLLYAVLIAMPICGWVGSVAAGYIPHFFSFKFALPIPKSKAIDDLAFSIHNTLAIVIITVVSIHILAALYHHVIKKDNVLLRMMPTKGDSN
ncbi:MAG: cytochrome b [Gammaproteobacteria bacterium]